MHLMNGGSSCSSDVVCAGHSISSKSSVLETRKPRSMTRTAVGNQSYAPSRRSSALKYQEPPRSTRRPQSPAQQPDVHSHTFPQHVRQARRVGSVVADRARTLIVAPIAATHAVGRPRRRTLPFRLRRQAIRRTRPTAQPLHVLPGVVPAHLHHRMTVRLRKPVVVLPTIVSRAPRRRHERPILPHRHLVATHRQTAPRQHHHLRALLTVPKGVTRTTRRAHAGPAIEGPALGTSAGHPRPGSR